MCGQKSPIYVCPNADQMALGMVVIYFTSDFTSISPSPKELELFIFTARKRSLGRGNVFTPVCLSTGDFHPQQGVPSLGEVLSLGSSILSRGCHPQQGGFHEGGAIKYRGVVKDPPPGRSTSGQYASYWNAFLLEHFQTSDFYTSIPHPQYRTTHMEDFDIMETSLCTGRLPSRYHYSSCMQQLYVQTFQIVIKCEMGGSKGTTDFQIYTKAFQQDAYRLLAANVRNSIVTRCQHQWEGGLQ